MAAINLGWVYGRWLPLQSGLAGTNNVLPESNNERYPTLLTMPAIGSARSSAILGPTENL